MLDTKLVIATSACICHWLAPVTGAATPTASMRLGSWSSEYGVHPGVALVGNDNLPALIVVPVGFGPPETLAVQSVADCAPSLASDVGALVGAEVVACVDLPLSPKATTR